VNFLFRAKRDKTAACRYSEKAIAGNGAPETVTMDKNEHFYSVNPASS
jgi:putative transposase